MRVVHWLEQGDRLWTNIGGRGEEGDRDWTNSGAERYSVGCKECFDWVGGNCLGVFDWEVKFWCS